MWRFVITCKSLLLLLVLIPILAHSQSTLSQQVSENDSSESQMTLNVLWNIFGLRLPDRIIILSLCPILLVFQIIIIVMFLRHTSLLIKPGNVFFVLVLIEAGLNIHLIVTAIYHTIHQSSQVPENYPTICSGFGYAQALFEINHISYLYIFLFYVVFTIRHTLKKKTKTFWVIIHLIIFLCCLGITNYLYFEQFIGLNFTGICGITSLFKLNLSVDWNILAPVFGIIFIIFFFGFGIFAFQYYKKHMPQGQLKNRKSQYSGIILLFVVGFSICQVVPNLCCLVLAISYNQGKSVQSMHPFISVTNLVRVIEYYFTIFLIVWNSQFRNKLKFMLKKIINSCCHCNKDMQKSSSINEDNLRTKLQLSQIIVNQKLLKIKDSSNQIDLLFVSQIYTILSGVYAIFYEYFNMSLQNKIQVKEPKPINYKESITIQVDKQSMKKYQFQTRMMLQLQVLKCRLIFFFPKVFLNLLVSDGLFNIFQSFGIFENAEKILSTAVDGQGGKSGQFFFFTADRKYVLKTITQEQFQFLKSHMVDFYDHYKYNPQSVLAKIYGLMIFKGDQIQRTYRLILMKNIMGCQRQQIERVYDIKGSTYDREVVTTKNEGYFLKQLTLKDLDFIKYEGKLHIDDQKSHILRMIIKKDVQFLKNLNLIDYSFLVVKAKWDKKPQNPNFWGQYQRIVHHQKPNQYYHIGIIDYLQLWDLQKKGESFWKKITLKKGISAVNPTNYCVRFLNFIDQISINFESSARAEQAISNIQQVLQKMLKQKQQEKNKAEVENQRSSESN